MAAQKWQRTPPGGSAQRGQICGQEQQEAQLRPDWAQLGQGV